jgi:PhnB protein
MINPYLTFAGNCREAMNFYQSCLGGELSFQTIGETPLAGDMPEEMKNRILHATLSKDKLVLMASDMVPDGGLIRGNAVSLSLECSSEDEIKSTFEKLSDGGSKDHPLENTFWGALFGDLTDKFGNHWLLHFQQPDTKEIKQPQSMRIH